MELQERDLALLEGLFESRLMTLDHATSLYFGGTGEYTKKRIQQLKRERYVAERPRKTFDKSVLFLARKGLEVLKDNGILARYPPFAMPSLERRARVSDLTVRHELDVMDVKTGFCSAIRNFVPLEIKKFNTWPLLNEFRTYHPATGKEIPVYPDGFLSIHEPEKNSKGLAHDFFLEVDRSNESQELLVNRAAGYVSYYKSGEYAVRNGGTREEYKDYPFRVLMVFKTDERRNNTAERLLQGNMIILNQICLATIEEVTKDPFGEIWLCPADYREATRGTSYEPSCRNRPQPYRRDVERDRYIENKVRKWSLLKDTNQTTLRHDSTKATKSLF